MPNGFTEQDREDFNHLKRDMWYGNGKKGVTTRLDLGEDRMDRLEKAQGKQNTKQNWALTLLITTLVAVIVNLVTKH